MESLRFNGTGSEYFKIWIVNVLLTIITLGLYFPWAKVRNRRYFYANSTLSDRNFEYHATGKQLFIGFLIAMGFFIAYTFLGQLHPSMAGILMLILFVSLPWLIWRSLMFNMRVTSFSNVHFSFVGGLGQAYLNYFVYPFFLIVMVYGMPVVMAFIAPHFIHGNPSMLSENSSALMTVLSIVMFVAWVFAFYLFAVIKKRNTEYTINGSRYGQGVFETSVDSKEFLKINLKSMGFGIIIMLVSIGIFAGFGGSNAFSLLSRPEIFKDGQIPEGMFALIGLSYVIMLFAMMFIISYTMTRQRRYIYENTTLDNQIAFKSTLRARDLSWVMLSNMFLIVLTLGLALPWTKVRMARLILENTLVDTKNSLDDYISQREKEQSSLGEQIGDAFDVDVGIAL